MYKYTVFSQKLRKIYQVAFAARYICIWIQRMKFVRWNGSSAGYSMPAALPASMQ